MLSVIDMDIAAADTDPLDFHKNLVRSRFRYADFTEGDYARFSHDLLDHFSILKTHDGPP